MEVPDLHLSLSSTLHDSYSTLPWRDKLWEFYDEQLVEKNNQLKKRKKPPNILIEQLRLSFLDETWESEKRPSSSFKELELNSAPLPPTSYREFIQSQLHSSANNLNYEPSANMEVSHYKQWPSKENPYLSLGRVSKQQNVTPSDSTITHLRLTKPVTTTFDSELWLKKFLSAQKLQDESVSLDQSTLDGSFLYNRYTGVLCKDCFASDCVHIEASKGVKKVYKLSNASKFTGDYVSRIESLEYRKISTPDDENNDVMVTEIKRNMQVLDKKWNNLINITDKMSLVKIREAYHNNKIKFEDMVLNHLLEDIQNQVSDRQFFDSFDSNQTDTTQNSESLSVNKPQQDKQDNQTDRNLPAYQDQKECQVNDFFISQQELMMTPNQTLNYTHDEQKDGIINYCAAHYLAGNLWSLDDSQLSESLYYDSDYDDGSYLRSCISRTSYAQDSKSPAQFIDLPYYNQIYDQNMTQDPYLAPLVFSPIMASSPVQTQSNDNLSRSQGRRSLRKSQSNLETVYEVDEEAIPKTPFNIEEEATVKIDSKGAHFKKITTVSSSLSKKTKDDYLDNNLNSRQYTKASESIYHSKCQHKIDNLLHNTYDHKVNLDTKRKKSKETVTKKSSMPNDKVTLDTQRQNSKEIVTKKSTVPSDQDISALCPNSIKSDIPKLKEKHESLKLMASIDEIVYDIHLGHQKTREAIDHLQKAHEDLSRAEEKEKSDFLTQKTEKRKETDSGSEGEESEEENSEGVLLISRLQVTYDLMREHRNLSIESMLSNSRSFSYFSKAGEEGNEDDSDSESDSDFEQDSINGENNMGMKNENNIDKIHYDRSLLTGKKGNTTNDNGSNNSHSRKEYINLKHGKYIKDEPEIYPSPPNERKTRINRTDILQKRDTLAHHGGIQRVPISQKISALNKIRQRNPGHNIQRNSTVGSRLQPKPPSFPKHRSQIPGVNKSTGWKKSPATAQRYTQTLRSTNSGHLPDIQRRYSQSHGRKTQVKREDTTTLPLI